MNETPKIFLIQSIVHKKRSVIRGLMNSYRLPLVFVSLFSSSRTMLFSLQQKVNPKMQFTPILLMIEALARFHSQDNSPSNIPHPDPHTPFLLYHYIHLGPLNDACPTIA